MNGSKNKEVKKIVIDTNIIFMALYDPDGKAGKILKSASEGKIKLFAPDSVNEEIIRVLKREYSFSDEKINAILERPPITWVGRDIYYDFISKTKVKHKPDKPIEALSLVLNCGILSADTDFKDRLNVDELLEELEG